VLGDQVVSGSYEKTCIIWDAETGDRVSQLKGHTDEVRSVAWSPKGDQIVPGSRDTICKLALHDKTAVVWDAANGEQVELT
jgi:WD40 repeat protein